MLIGFSDSVENKELTRATIGDKDASEAYWLYKAAFNRTPDTAGLDYWTSTLDQGATPLAVSNSFAPGSEFIKSFGALDNNGFVNQLYQSVLGRTPDADGAGYWTGTLNTGV